MKNYLLLFTLSVFTTLAYSQNKSLGVGTTTPNPNAALDVSSPTNNQGALMPRLTTAQRTAMTGILGAPDAGLLLYDNDEKVLYIWNGTAWESSAKIRYPQVDTLSTLPPNGNALRIVYNGTDVGNFGVAHFENMNPNSGFSAIFGRTNSATNGAADFMVSNPANTNDAVGVTTNALNGRAGAFSLNNAGSRNHALYAQSNGDSTGSAVHGNNIGNGFGVFGKSAGSKFASAAVYGEHVGTGDAAGAFRINNPGNTYAALYGETNGSGSALFANNLGTVGRGAQIQINNAANPNAAMRAFTNGIGNAGFFTVNNPSSTAYSLLAETNGDSLSAAIHGSNTGNGFGVYGKSVGTKFASAAVYGEHLGTGDAAGAFRINNVANPNAAVYAETNGNTGAAVSARQIGTAGGHAGYFQVGSATNIIGTGAAVFGVQFGTGRAGQFQISNTASTSAALRGFTNGLSNAGFFTVNNPVNDAPALMGETNGVGAAVYGLNSGPGDTFSPAGHFVVNNATNNHAAVQGNNSGNGPAGRFLIESASNTASAVDANTIGTGGAGNFTINNGTSGANAINASTNGSGTAMSALNSGTGFAMYARAFGATDALYAVKQVGDGAGSAGNFQNMEPANGASTLFAMTNAGTGTAIGAINSANGNAFTIFTGGLRVSTQALTGGGNINTRAVAYTIDAAAYTINFPLNEGDVFHFFNTDGASNASVNSITIPVSSTGGVTLIYIGGALRQF